MRRVLNRKELREGIIAPEVSEEELTPNELRAKLTAAFPGQAADNIDAVIRLVVEKNLNLDTVVWHCARCGRPTLSVYVNDPDFLADWKEYVTCGCGKGDGLCNDCFLRRTPITTVAETLRAKLATTFPDRTTADIDGVIRRVVADGRDLDTVIGHCGRCGQPILAVYVADDVDLYGEWYDYLAFEGPLCDCCYCEVREKEDAREEGRPIGQRTILQRREIKG